jgi:hypothetical protein
MSCASAGQIFETGFLDHRPPGHQTKEDSMIVRLSAVPVTVGLVVILGASLALAAVLSPGAGPVAPDSFSIGYSGTQQAFTTPSSGTPFSTSGGSISGNALMQVVSDPNNAFCAGCLDFIVQIKNNSGSSANISSLTLSGYAGFQTDVGYDLLSVGGATECGPADNGFCNVSGTGALGTVSRDATGNVITFTFAGSGLAPGQASTDFVVETNTHSFVSAAVSVFGVNSTSAVGVSGIFSPQPASPTPTPTPTPIPSPTPAPPTGLLVGTALLALIPGFLLARRYRQQE